MTAMQVLTYPYSDDIFAQQAAWNAFDHRSKAFISTLSKRLLSQGSGSDGADLVALGYWFRDSAVKKIESNLLLPAENWIKPVGRVFQIAPGNVEVLFLYTGLLSLLLGNQTVTRISNRESPLLVALLIELNAVLCMPEHQAIGRRFEVIRCEYDDSVLTALSSACDLRLLWGSDESINAMRQHPIGSSAKDLSFASRFSFSLIELSVLEDIKSQDSAGYCQLIDLFCRDAYQFKQQACSSSRGVVWVGRNLSSERASSLIEQFWLDVEICFKARYAAPSAAEIIQRLNGRQSLSAAGMVVRLIEHKAAFDRVHIEEIGSELIKHHLGCGLFFEMKISDISELVLPSGRACQTMGVCVNDESNIREWLLRACTALPDRIVPVGQMNWFDRIWDGYDLCREMTSTVALPFCTKKVAERAL